VEEDLVTISLEILVLTIIFTLGGLFLVGWAIHGLLFYQEPKEEEKPPMLRDSDG
jgi:hypothetical protein